MVVCALTTIIMKFVFIFIVAAFSAVADFVSGNESAAPPQIIGGTDAAINEFPWQASLRKKTDGEHICGGSLISSKWILTAAHCCYADGRFTIIKSPASIQIYLGAHYTFGKTIPGEKVFNVDAIIPHEDFSRNKFNYDIALVRMTQKVLESQFIKIITMAGPRDRLVGGEDVVLSGWGNIFEKPFQLPPTGEVLEFNFCGKHYKYGLEEASKFPIENTKCGTLQFRNLFGKFVGTPYVLQKVTVPVQPESRCKHLFKEVSYCLGNSKQGGCHGDSGGPMVRKINGKWTLFGVTSYGDPQCRTEKDFGRYTKVSHYNEWIAKAMRSRV